MPVSLGLEGGVKGGHGIEFLRAVNPVKGGVGPLSPALAKCLAFVWYVCQVADCWPRVHTKAGRATSGRAQYLKSGWVPPSLPFCAAISRRSRLQAAPPSPYFTLL